MSIITVEKDGIPVGFSSRLNAIREKANKFLHHKLGSDELAEEEEKETKLPIKKQPVVVDTSMGPSDKEPINGGFTGRDKEKEQKQKKVRVKEEEDKEEDERADDKSSGDEKPIVKVVKKEENTGEQDDNAKEDDDAADSKKSKSETIKVDKNEEG
jgi:hypothetical protein